jgi:hypothetical protein
LKSALDQIWILLVNLPCRAESNNNDSNNFMDHSALSIIFLHWKLKIERWKREPFCLLVLNWLVPYIDHESSRFLPGSSSKHEQIQHRHVSTYFVISMKVVSFHYSLLLPPLSGGVLGCFFLLFTLYSLTHSWNQQNLIGQKILIWYWKPLRHLESRLILIIIHLL